MAWAVREAGDGGRPGGWQGKEEQQELRTAPLTTLLP